MDADILSYFLDPDHPENLGAAADAIASDLTGDITEGDTTPPPPGWDAILNAYREGLVNGLEDYRSDFDDIVAQVNSRPTPKS